MPFDTISGHCRTDDHDLCAIPHECACPCHNRCPYCGFDAQGNAWVEVAHMNAVHPDIVANRLRKAGIHPNEL